MYKNFTILFLSVFLLTSCSQNPRNVFRKSPNNQLFATKGFQNTKRRPLYNAKYISQAKRNIALDQDCCDDEDENCDETEFKVPSKVYKNMYMEMLADEYARKKERLRDYPQGNCRSLDKANNRVRELPVQDNRALQQEMAEIKSMLKQTKADLVKYRCKPTAVKHELENVKTLPREVKNSSDEIINPREDVIDMPIKNDTILQRKFIIEDEKSSAREVKNSSDENYKS